ncbi:hypothetical protein LSH36_487g01032 [Paralvinella palmiformis]|uniref:Uncharacterized protein n=1 Tax=Paralvinella palmiformis TaxID=53620 RepID=A0AAD9MZF8_9ANNE|nr:hypothetical protein LSH36_487g01032 [Paralvinella palmiformis]
MEALTDNRSFLDCDDEFVATESKFSELEHSLNTSCDLMERILEKVNHTKVDIRAAARLVNPECTKVLMRRLLQLRTLYAVYYELSIHQSEQLIFLHDYQLKHEERHPFDYNLDDFVSRD